jgi:hypothetical protein
MSTLPSYTFALTHGVSQIAVTWNVSSDLLPKLEKFLTGLLFSVTSTYFFIIFVRIVVPTTSRLCMLWYCAEAGFTLSGDQVVLIIDYGYFFFVI